jgi:type I restriction enzyme M protein
MNTSNIVQKLWNYCNVLHDDGISYGDYVEQLTYLLFLKMADERTKAPYNQESRSFGSVRSHHQTPERAG